MDLIIITSAALKTLAKTHQVKRLLASNLKVMVTDLALHNLKRGVGFSVVKRLISAGYIAVMDTVDLDNIDQYSALNLNLEECSIRKIIDTYAENDAAVTILVDEAWAEMQLDNIQVISTAKYLKSQPLITPELITKMIGLRNLEGAD